MNDDKFRGLEAAGSVRRGHAISEHWTQRAQRGQEVPAQQLRCGRLPSRRGCNRISTLHFQYENGAEA